MVVVAIVAGAIGISALFHHNPAPVAECRVRVGTSAYVLDPQQAANATTITAVAQRLGMPDHAVTIALATALQESQLHNLSYGDRDSLGLFQQRPSQGWGRPAQLMDPRYAATAFFNALARVPGWRTTSVTDAAQAVQHSNAPQAYAVWEPLARTLAIATTGEVPAAFACQFTPLRAQAVPPSPVAAVARDFGSPQLDTPLSPARGWTVASWLVGHADLYGITSVRYRTHQWTPRGSWNVIRDAGREVRITQAPAKP